MGVVFMGIADGDIINYWELAIHFVTHWPEQKWDNLKRVT
jgi:hypothetical protein